MEDTAKPKQRRLLPVILIAGVLCACTIIWWSIRQPGEFIASLPIPTLSKVHISSVPPESDAVCLSVTHYSGNLDRVVNYLIHIPRRKVERLSFPSGRVRVMPANGSGSAPTLLPAPDFPSDEVYVWAVKRNSLYCGDLFGEYCLPRSGGKPRLLADLRFDRYWSEAKVIVPGHATSRSAKTVLRFLDIESGNTIPMSFPSKFSLITVGRGDHTSPVVLLLEAPVMLGHSHREIWLADVAGNIIKKVAWRGGPSTTACVDGRGNLYVWDSGTGGHILWLYPKGSIKPRKMVRLSARDGVVLQATGDGVCMGIRRYRWGAMGFMDAVHTMSTYGTANRAAQMLKPAAIAYLMTSPMDLWYFSTKGSVRRRIVCGVSTFAASPESNTVYFIQGRELRCATLPGGR